MTPADRVRDLESLVWLLERLVGTLEDPAAAAVRSFIDRASADPTSIDDDEIRSVERASKVWAAVDRDLRQVARIQPAIATRQRVARIRRDRAHRLRSAGLTYAQIADEMKVDPRTVWRWFEKKTPDTTP